MSTSFYIIESRKTQKGEKLLTEFAISTIFINGDYLNLLLNCWHCIGKDNSIATFGQLATRNACADLFLLFYVLIFFSFLIFEIKLVDFILLTAM
jgi:hypothetical protein